MRTTNNKTPMSSDFRSGAPHLLHVHFRSSQSSRHAVLTQRSTMRRRRRCVVFVCSSGFLIYRKCDHKAIRCEIRRGDLDTVIVAIIAIVERSSISNTRTHVGKLCICIYRRKPLSYGQSKSISYFLISDTKQIGNKLDVNNVILYWDLGEG